MILALGLVVGLDAATAHPAVAATPTAPGAPVITKVYPANQIVKIDFTPPASNGGAAITSYQYTLTAGLTWTTFSPALPASPVVISGLTNGKPLRLAFRAVNSVGAGAMSNVVDTAASDFPGAPILGKVAVGSQAISVAFTPPTYTGGTPITNYQYSLDGGSTWITRNPSSVASPLAISGLVNGQAYPLRLRAVNLAGGGTASAQVSVTPVAPPGAPAVTTVVGGNGTARVNFNAPAGGPPTGYRYSVDGGATWRDRSPQSTTSPLDITGLTNGTSYTIAIRAFNAAGDGPPSNVKTVVPSTVPSTPQLARVSSEGSKKVSLWFKAPGNNGGAALTGYECSTNGGTSWAACTPVTAGEGLAVSFSAADGTTLRLMARAKNINGAGDPTGVLPITVGAPGDPRVQTITPGNASASVAFDAPWPVFLGVTNYKYSIDDGATWTTRSPAATTTPLVITGLTNGTRYVVRIRGVNQFGDGLISNWLPVTPGVAGPPTISTWTSADRTANVYFSAPTDNGGFAIKNYQYSLDGGTTWVPRVPAAVTSPLTITGLTNGATYNVRLRAVTDFGPGQPSDVRAISVPTTAPSAPSINWVTPRNKALEVAYAAPQSNGGSPITGYDVSLDGGTTWASASACPGSGICVSSLVNGQQYRVALRARNAIGTSAPSNVVAAIVGAPSAPRAFRVSPGNGYAAVYFQPPVADGFNATPTGMLYSYSLNGGTTWSTAGPARTAGDGLGLNIPVANGTLVTIALRAVNNVPLPGLATAALPLRVGAPGAPQITGVTGGVGSLQVAFTPAWPDFGSLSNYEYSTDGGRTWVTRSPAATTSPLTITGLSSGVSYQVALRGKNANGSGVTSNIVSGTAR